MASDFETAPLASPSLNNPYQRAAKSYKTNSYQGLSQRELMVRIFQKLMNHLYMARDAYMVKNFELLAEQNAKAIHILDVLREELIGSDALQDPEAVQPAQMLIQFYGQTIIRIANVLASPSPEAAFDDIIENIKPVYQAWMPTQMDKAGEEINDASLMSFTTDS